ncbi:MAG TPA: hypothetical protein DHW61_16010 [Lachnoclostridium phytofermentans]|uniref:DUF3168 domain-containing protein n=1 Tax=Lachnoclostridium phytofermentans TaxID=66219 RepID=A0A3D2XBI6_9FIRM|nr:hypothetical protein [Lachnoclostridium sp.]HCL03885.1 hypothetical protein [Lachnoclostridium phytofermentans]
MEAEIINLIKINLNIPCSDLNGSLLTPSATVEVYSESGGIFGDGKASNDIGYVQVDLWYPKSPKGKEDRDIAVKLLKKALIETNKYTHPEIHRYYDTTALRYRATFKFSGIIRKG